MLIRTKENTFRIDFSDGNEYSFIKGTTLLEILDFIRHEDHRNIILAKVNNRICNLHRRIDEDCKIEWLAMDSLEGIQAYRLTLCLILIRAVHDLYPKKSVLIDHSIGNGLYCEFKKERCYNPLTIKKINNRMHKIIQENEPILPIQMTSSDFKTYLERHGGGNLGNEKSFFTVYQCGGSTEYLGYPLLPSTGTLNAFYLRLRPPGLILCFPEKNDPNRLSAFPKPYNLFRVFSETRKWETILGIQTTTDINRSAASGTLSELIKIAEGFHEKKIAALADRITKKKRTLRIVLIAGPSSSGKTTFTKRLSIQLRVNGSVPMSLSIDDYFLDNASVPKDDRGNPDFESINALDIPRFNADLLALMDGKSVQLPKFDFVTGKRKAGPTVQIHKDQPILIEGLHALNDKLTRLIPRRNMFKLYVSALTQLNITDASRVSTSDVRLIRRLVRDHRYRNHPASFTLGHWQKVRQGEEKYIFPFQEQADSIFNSSLMYELSALRPFAQLLLEQVSETDSAYPEAQRMLEFLYFFTPVSAREVPSNSILREFIGGSSFEY